MRMLFTNDMLKLDLSDAEYKVIQELNNNFAKAKSEFPSFYKDKKAYNYKYVELSQILDKVEPILYKHKISLTQEINDDTISTIITDIDTGVGRVLSKISIKDNMFVGKNNLQELGIAITYIRRYQLLVAFNIVGDEDTDAQELTKKPNNTNSKYVLDTSLKRTASNIVNHVEFMQKLKNTKSHFNDEQKEFIEKLKNIDYFITIEPSKIKAVMEAL